MPSTGFRARSIAIDAGCDRHGLDVRYVVDSRPPALLRVEGLAAASLPASALDVVVASAAVYLGSLCLAQEIEVQRPLSLGLREDLMRLVEMLYDIRRWKDDLPLGPLPEFTGPTRSRTTVGQQSLDPRASVPLWSGGKDSTLGILTLRANGYAIHPLHVQANSGVEMVELEAVRRLSARLAQPFDTVALIHDDFVSLTNAYADEWDAFPLCNRVPFGRDLLLGAVAAAHALECGAANVSLGHDNECRTATVVHRGKTIPRNDLESTEGALQFEAIVRRHVDRGLSLLPAVANLSELRILRDMFVYHPELMQETSFCFWGERCGRCAKCLRYYLADQLYGGGCLRFDVNPLATGACPELSDHLHPSPRSTLFQTEVLFMLGRLAQQRDALDDEHELARFHAERLDEIEPRLDHWELDLMAERGDPQLPSQYVPMYDDAPRSVEISG